MTTASLRLLELARALAAAYRPLPGVRAAMVTGSVADGLSDLYSDVDMAVYYDRLPGEEELARVREAFSGSAERRWVLGDRQQGTVMEGFAVGGVECQVVHATPEAVESQVDSILVEHQVVSPAHKAMGGLLKSVPLFGGALIQGWKDRIAGFPQPLAEKMVRHYLSFFPVWGLAHQFTQRDARLFYQQSLLEAAQNLLGVLAGLNRAYYSTFQFKRAGKFIEGLAIKPPRLYERLERLFDLEVEAAGAELESLVAETLSLVEAHLPQVDVQAARKRIGWRQRPWRMEALDEFIAERLEGGDRVK